MLEVIVMMGVIAWFSRTAKRMGRSGFLWGFIGATSYYVPVLVFGRAVYPELVRSEIGSDNVVQYMLLGMILTLAVGIGSCFLARLVLLSSAASSRARLSAEQAEVGQ